MLGPDPTYSKRFSRLHHKPLALQEGPKFASKVYHVGEWRSMDDAARLRWLTEFGNLYGNDPRMREFTINHVLRPAGIQGRDYERQAKAILAWLQQNILYVNEPGEQLASPWHTLRVRHGDCDDMAILGYAMAKSVALPVRYILAGKDRKTGARVRWTPTRRQRKPPKRFKFFHIYLQLGWPPFKPSVWRSAEPTVKGAPLGYDVVRHGPPKRGPNGTPTLPELAGYGFYGEEEKPPSTELVAEAVETPSGIAVDAVAIEAAESGSKAGNVRAFLSKLNWLQISTSVIQGVLITLIVQRLLRKRAARRG